MTVFLTLGVYSINVSSNFPLQSIYIPSINIYFLLGVFYTFISLGWFVIAEFLRSFSVLPTILLQIAYFSNYILCFNRYKIDLNKKVNETNKVSPTNSNTLFRKKESNNKNEETSKQTEYENSTNIMSIKALNYLVFLIMFISQLVTYIYIWVSLAVNTS